MKNFNTIVSKELFSNEILNYQVETEKYGRTNYVNLDNAATTPPLLEVQNGVNDFLASYGSIHRGAGSKSKISTEIYEESREVIKDFVNAPKDSYVLFSENTTEAMNLTSYFFSFLKGKVAVSAIEHSSSWLPWVKAEGIKAIGREQVKLHSMETVNHQIQIAGREQVVRYDVNDKFEFDLNSIEKLLQKNDVKVFVLTASSNINGYCPEIKNIGKLVHKYNALFVVDACQYLQHHEIDMQDMGIDFLAASGHKFYAPYGSGFLVGSKKFFDEFLPYQIGGGNLPYITEEGEFLRYRNQLAHDPGTSNSVGAVAMGLALKQLSKLGIDNVKNYESKLANRLFAYMKSNEKIQLFVNDDHLNTVIPFRISGMDSVEVAEKLNTVYGIGVRAGSFCVYQVVRKLLKLKDEFDIVSSVKNGDISKIPSLVRASIALCNTEEDVDRMIEALNEMTK